MDGRKKDALRQANADEFTSKPKRSYSDTFQSSATPEAREQIRLILDTAQKYQPYTKKK